MITFTAMLPVMERAAVVLFVDGRLAVIDRVRPGVGRYQVLPGGGVEPGETAAQAAIREAWEETGLRVELAPRPPLRLDAARGVQWVFTASAISGTFGDGRGAEYSREREDEGTYRPMLLTRAELTGLNLVPLAVAEAVLRSWATGRWWDEHVVLDDMAEHTPERVRGSAIVLRDDRILLIERWHEGRRWYEIPGGGAEHGETPAEAAERELFEETGLRGTVGREVAVVYRYGHELHFFVVTAEGPLGRRETLDLESDASPVWLPLHEFAAAPVWPKRLGWRIAEWAISGWPEAAVRLWDSILDLEPACDW